MNQMIVVGLTVESLAFLMLGEVFEHTFIVTHTNPREKFSLCGGKPEVVYSSTSSYLRWPWKFNDVDQWEASDL